MEGQCSRIDDGIEEDGYYFRLYKTGIAFCKGECSNKCLDAVRNMNQEIIQQMIT